MGVLIYHVLMVLPVAGTNATNLQQVDVFDGDLLTQHVLLGFFNGRGLVVLFFVLSGCVLALSMDRRSNFKASNLPGYWVRRGFRLYPVLIVAATSGAILQWFVASAGVPYDSAWAEWHYNVPRDEIFVEWLKNISGLSASLNSPAWSIRVELLASLVFPLLYALTLRPVLAAVAVALSFVFMFILPRQEHDYLHLHIFVFSFLLGALVPRYGRGLADRFGGLRPRTKVFVLTCVLLAFMFTRRLIDPINFVPKPVVIIESVASAFIVSLALFRQVPRFMHSPIVQALGRISYGIYLFHLIVLFGLVYLLFPLLPPAVGGSALLLSLLLCMLTIGITLPLAWYLYGAVEEPLQRFGSRAGFVVDRAVAGSDRSDGQLPEPRRAPRNGE